MQCNVGRVDQVIRIVIGLVLIGLVFFGPQTPWGWIGIVPLLTGLSRRCPAYMPFGIRTCSKSS